MATAVFTGADIAFASATSPLGGAGWIAAAAAWTLTNDVNGDSGVVTNVPAGANEGILVQGTLVDDASIPASVRVSSVQIEFDWHIINVGGTVGTNPRPTSFIVDSGITNTFHTVSQAADSDTTGHYDFTYPNAFTYFSNLPGTRARLFAASYGFNFAAPQRDGANTSQVVVSNFTVTIQYTNTGIGSWLVRTAAMANPTGSMDFATFAPDVAQLTGPSETGTIDVPIDDVAGAYIYVDGGAVPVAFAGLASGFTAESVFAVHADQGVTIAGDSFALALAPLIAVSETTPPSSASDAPAADFYSTGMNNAELAALVGQTMLATLVTGTDPATGNFRNYIESDSSIGWGDFSVGIWGTYTLAAPEVTSIHPNRGSVNGGQAVTIRGTGFTGAPGASVGGVALTSFVVVDDETITGVTGEHLAGVVDVEVTGVGTLTGGYTYVIPPTFLLDPLPTRTPIAQGGGARGGGGVRRGR